MIGRCSWAKLFTSGPGSEKDKKEWSGSHYPIQEHTLNDLYPIGNASSRFHHLAIVSGLETKPLIMGFWGTLMIKTYKHFVKTKLPQAQ
jgi:hypothetical protein